MNILDKYLDLYLGETDVVPSISYLWEKAQPYVDQNDDHKIKRIENLIFVIHNSVVSPRTRLGRGVKFSYGGIGTVIHKDAVIGNGVSIGQNVTVGGSPGKYGIGMDGKRFYVPRIEDNVYIAAGCRVFGGIKVGKFTVLGANSVVLSDVEEFSIYAGQPAKKIKKINKNNCLMYRAFFHDLKGLEEASYISLFPEH